MPVRYFTKQRTLELFLINGRFYNKNLELVEYDGERWRVVVDAALSGWWRYHKHYDRDGYCDNPGRGY